MNAETFHMSVQGASHIRDGRECQDASDSYHDERCSIAIVCDGHGDKDYIRSAAGSKFGCAVARKNIKEFLDGTDGEDFFQETEQRLRRLEESIISAWNEEVKEHFARNPFSGEELSMVSAKRREQYRQGREIERAYGTTMIAVAVTPEYWFGIHIGDGKCVMVNREGVFSQPIPWDPRCFLNSTTSICDMNAIDHFRHYYSGELPAAVFVGSDGVDDCFGNDEQLHYLYKTALYSFSTSCFEEAEAGLRDYLPRLSARGSKDDVSMAAILDMECVPELEVVKSYSLEREKARLQEKAREEEKARQEERTQMEKETGQQEENRPLRERREEEKAGSQEDVSGEDISGENISGEDIFGEDTSEEDISGEDTSGGVISGAEKPGNPQESERSDMEETGAEESAVVVMGTEENPGRAKDCTGLTDGEDPQGATQGEDAPQETVQDEEAPQKGAQDEKVQTAK